MPRYSRSFKQKAVVMYVKGVSCKTVAAELGVSHESVRKWVKEYGLTVRGFCAIKNMPTHKRRTSTSERFWSKVNKTSGSVSHYAIGECWEWVGSSASGGYGTFWDGNKHTYAHRFSWEYHNRQAIPDGCVVMHTCDNPSCVRPGHLTIGTRSENVLDSVRKKRWGGFQHKGI